MHPGCSKLKITTRYYLVSMLMTLTRSFVFRLCPNFLLQELAKLLNSKTVKFKNHAQVLYYVILSDGNLILVSD